MLINKKILSLIGLFILISLFSISCSSKQNPTKIKPIDLVGRWNCTDAGGEAAYFTINEAGNMTIFDGQTSRTIPINNWESEKNVEQNAPFILESGAVVFSFTSTTEATITYTGVGTAHFKKQ